MSQEREINRNLFIYRNKTHWWVAGVGRWLMPAQGTGSRMLGSSGVQDKGKSHGKDMEKIKW